LSSTPPDIAVTLDGLSHIVTPELARDVSPELIAMLNHSRPNIRKRAILALYKTLVKYPEATNQARVRLEEKLEDLDSCKFPFNLFRKSVLIGIFSCGCGDSECPLRTCSAEPERLPLTCPAVFPSANLLNKQLDAHQNYQAGKQIESPRPLLAHISINSLVLCVPMNPV
jgi:hypothetical protein